MVVTPGDVLEFDPDSPRAFTRTRMDLRSATASLAAETSGGPRRSVMQRSLARSLPTLLDDLWTGELPAPVDPRGAHLWLGGPALVTPLHHDPVHNFYVQLHGHKRMLLAAPDEFDGLHPGPMDAASPRSRASPRSPT